MARLLVYYAHPGHKHSQVNRYMARAAAGVPDIDLVDLYSDYPRFDIDVEQERLVGHDVILFQFPLFWYSTPSIIKEWQDLVLEHGFAYGSHGDRLASKCMMLAVTAAGPADANTPHGYQHYPLRTFLTPLEQTARLCNMRFAALTRAVWRAAVQKLRAFRLAYREAYEAWRSGARDIAFPAGTWWVVRCAGAAAAT